MWEYLFRIGTKHIHYGSQTSLGVQNADCSNVCLGLKLLSAISQLFYEFCFCMLGVFIIIALPMQFQRVFTTYVLKESLRQLHYAKHVSAIYSIISRL